MTIGIKDLIERVNSDTVQPLPSEYDIEEVILSVSGIDKKVEWLKNLRDSRVERISQDINILEARKERLRQIVITTLDHFKKKSLSFPGIGKVSVRESQGKWAVLDEEALVNELSKIIDKETLDSVTVTKTAIAKTVLSKVLDALEPSGNLPKSAKREDSRQVLSLTIDKALTEAAKSKEIIEAVGEIDISQLDELSI
jgi:hypothetical protein